MLKNHKKIEKPQKLQKAQNLQQPKKTKTAAKTAKGAKIMLAAKWNQLKNCKIRASNGLPAPLCHMSVSLDNYTEVE